MGILTIIILAVLVNHFVTGQEIDVISAFYPSTLDVYEGMDITIACRVTQDFNPATDALLIYRETPTLIALAQPQGLVTGAPANVMYLGFSNNELRLRISNIQLYDSGEYGCAATRRIMIGQSSTGIGRRVLSINVKNSYPPQGQPECFIPSGNSSLTLEKGETLQMICSSDAGQPEVVLQWGSTGNFTIPEAVPYFSDRSDENTLGSGLTLKIDNSFDGIQFTCSRVSDLFPSSDDSCSLGPFLLQDQVYTVSTTDIMNTTPKSSTDSRTHFNVVVLAVIAIAASLFLFSIIAFIVWKSGFVTISCQVPRDSRSKMHNNPNASDKHGGDRVYESSINRPNTKNGSQNNSMQNVSDPYMELEKSEITESMYMGLINEDTGYEEPPNMEETNVNKDGGAYENGVVNYENVP